MEEFLVIDLTPRCEIRSAMGYRHDLLERVEGAGDLIPALASSIWRDPEGFETHIGRGEGVHLRWAATSDASGILRLSEGDKCLSLSVLCSGQDANAEQETLKAFQQHILRELHGTEYEGSCEVLHVERRPLLATLGLFAPAEPDNRTSFALADRCFAAAYFRRLGLV